MNPRVQSLVIEPEYTLQLTFANSEQRRPQLTSYLDVPVFRRLRVQPSSPSRAVHGTVTWPGGIAFDPDTFYVESMPVRATEGTTA